MPPLNVNLQELIDQVDADLTDGDELAKVSEARQRANTLAGVGDQLIDHFVTRARSAGASWSQIGGALGVSKQAAQQRWTPSVFSRFTDRARQVVVGAQDRARRLRHSVIGPEHILLSLLDVREGFAALALVGLAGSAEVIEERVSRTLTPGTTEPPTHIPFAPECKEALEQGMYQAMELGHNYIGTEHLLLGLLKLPRVPVVESLAELGVGYAEVRARVLEWLATRAPQP